MKIIQPSVEAMTEINGAEILRHVERCGRVCYKSEWKATDTSAESFCRKIISSGHESVLEHFTISIKLTVDRGVSHEIVRHRIASYSQESTRYCNYSKGEFGAQITVIEPCFLEPGTSAYNIWKRSCEHAETAYFDLLDYGLTPQEARDVLPNSLKTEIVMSANMREWRHFFKLRTAPAAHPQMRQAATLALELLRGKIPAVFDDIEIEETKA